MPVIEKLDLGFARKMIADQVASKESGYRYFPEDMLYGCTYIHGLNNTDEEDPCPGCIIGAALLANGVTVEDIRPRNAYTNADELINFLVKNGVIGSATPWGVAYLMIVQKQQDGCMPWDEAMEYANHAISNGMLDKQVGILSVLP